MKKVFGLLVVLLFSLPACGKKKTEAEQNQVKVAPLGVQTLGEPEKSSQSPKKEGSAEVVVATSSQKNTKAKPAQEEVFVYSNLRKDIQPATPRPIEAKLLQQRVGLENKLPPPAKDKDAPYLKRGTEEIKIIRLTNTPFVDERFPDISFDGKMLTYEAWFRKESGSKFANSIEFLELHKNAKKKVLVQDSYYNLRPSFIHGRSQIVFTSNSWQNEFRAKNMSWMSPNGVDLALRKYCENVLAVRYNHFGQALICYQKKGKSQPSIALLKETGELLSEVAFGEDPSWAPDGKQFLFVSLDGGYQDIYLANADGSDLIRLTTHFGICSKPSISPNGQWIVFSAYTTWNKKHDLFLMDRSGNHLSQLTDDDLGDQNPVWGRDGWIYFETNRFDQNTEIVKLDPVPLLKTFDKAVKDSPFVE